MGIALAIVLGVFVAAHVTLVAGLARSGASNAWVRALAALLVAPLAPWWGYRRGMRWQSYAWVGAVIAYAIGTAVA
jgi:hypothetical protein